MSEKQFNMQKKNGKLYNLKKKNRATCKYYLRRYLQFVLTFKRTYYCTSYYILRTYLCYVTLRRGNILNIIPLPIMLYIYLYITGSGTYVYYYYYY